MNLFNKHTIPDGTHATYIGRGSVYGNPYVMTNPSERDSVVIKYRKMLARKLAARDKQTVEMVLSLAGVENICCYCSPKPCHGDCFVEIWKLVRQDKLSPLEAIRHWVKDNGYPQGQQTDGVDHINIYSKGKTELGRLLTNMSDVPVTIPGIGQFRCMEAYWVYLSTGCMYPEVIRMSGFEAKKFGKDKNKEYTSLFQDKIQEALWLRFEQNKELKKQFIDSSLPLKHYYCYADDDRTVTFPAFDWLTNHLELLRDLYQGNKSSCIIAGSRDIMDIDLIKKAIEDSGFTFDVEVSGGAKGVDSIGEVIANESGKVIRRFHADWLRLKRSAGIIRNCSMGQFADKAIVVIKNNSPGSTHMADYMRGLGKPVHVVHISK